MRRYFDINLFENFFENVSRVVCQNKVTSLTLEAPTQNGITQEQN